MQFDVYRNPSKTTSGLYPFVLDIQSNLLAELPTRLVVPLRVLEPGSADTPPSLCPTLVVKGGKLSLVAYQAAPLSKKLLKKPVASLAGHSHEIVAAIDSVISGI